MTRRLFPLLLAAGLALAPALAAGQSRLSTYPGAARYQEVAPRLAGAVVSAAISPAWAEDSRSFTYDFAGKRWRFDLGQAAPAELGPVEPPARRVPAAAASGGVVLARGRGGENNIASPDGRWRAFTRDNDLWLRPAEGEGAERAITTDGDPAARIRNGTASYVYIEELNMGPALWWSPDSRKIAFLRFDESQVEQYFLALDQTERLSRIHTQAYPSPGTPNPVPDLFVHDLATGVTTRMEAREEPFSDRAMGHYLWAIEWTRDSGEVLLRRSARDQKRIELAACDARSGACRTVVAEDQPQSWASVSSPQFLADGRRFLWFSERNGFRNLYLYDLSGRELAALTRHPFEVAQVAGVDEARGEVWYTARGGDNPMKLQLHRVRLDGTDDRRLTDPALHHTVHLSPDRRHFVDVAQTHDSPPSAALLTRDGRRVAYLAASDLSGWRNLGLKPVEIFTYTSADGRTPLNGTIHFPSDFDPARKYPVLVSIYGGPGSTGAAETFTVPNRLTEYGFLIVTLDLRGTSGRGKAVSDMLYGQVGVAEIDDMAAAVRQLAARPYVDAARVGVFGTSYGGYASLLAILRHPQAFAAAAASSPVTDYRYYDSTYTERYLGMPDENKAAYDAGSALLNAANLEGDLMIFFGTSDDNVHPKNSLMLIEALQRAGKRFEVQVGPDRGHTALNTERMMEFFIESLVLD